MKEENSAINEVRALFSANPTTPYDRTQIAKILMLEPQAVSACLYALERKCEIRVYGDLNAKPRAFIATASNLLEDDPAPPAQVKAAPPPIQGIEAHEEEAEEIELQDLATAAKAAAESWRPPARMVVRPTDPPAMRQIAALFEVIGHKGAIQDYLLDVADRMEQAA